MLGNRHKLSLALAAALTCLGISAAAAQAGDLEVTSFSAPGLNPNGTPSTAAGARPYELTNNFTLNEINGLPAENPKDLRFDLPPGIVGNVASFPRCSQELMDTNACPPETQIGFVVLKLLSFGGSVRSAPNPVYNLEPPPGMPAQFGFRVLLSNSHVNFHIRTGSDYGVTASVHNAPITAPLYESSFKIWGVPGDPTHDGWRFLEPAGVPTPFPYPVSPPFLPFLSNPTSCAGPLVNTMETTTYQLPNEATFGTPFEAPAMSECNQLDFDPKVEAKPTTNLADSPSGLDFHLSIPQNQDADGKAVAHLRDSKVILPPSLTVNPSSANGLGACDLTQIGYTGTSGERQTITYNRDVASSFTVSSGGETTAPIPAAANRSQVTAAIETLPGLAGNVNLKGAPGGWVVSFAGDLAGTDIPALSGTVTDVAHQTIDITGTGGGFNLQAGGVDTEATFDASFGPQATSFMVTNNSRELKVGETIQGPGIAPGTKVTFYFSTGFMSISKPTTEKQPPVDGEPPVHLKTVLSLGSSASEIQTALEGLAAIGAGNVAVGGPSFNGPTRSFTVFATGALAGTEPAITASSSLSGPGAGATVSAAPATHPLGVTTNTEAGNPQFTPDAANCPDDSKLGTVKIESPAVIDHPLEGSVYLATPHQNPFNSLLAIYITVNDPKTGVVVKLPGLVELDPQSGQLTATVSEAPQLPFEDLTLEFLKGAVAPLKTGIACGTSTVQTDMVPWSSPEGATMHPSDSFSIDHGAGGGACVKDEASAPNTPSFEAGTVTPTAGAYSPFTLKLARADGTQQLTGIDTTLPKGLIAKLAGVPYCSDQALATAANKSGKSEQATPSCPSASKVGTVTVGAGAGPKPFFAQGTAYLAGPYRGAPLSLAVVTPAVAGPFDLGAVVVHNALYVDPESAHVHAVSDPFPHILQGIPLDLRSVVLNIDKPKFIRNPTNCSPFAITGAAQALTGQSAPLSNHFQVGDCAKLKFAPKLKLSLKGGTARSGHPALKAVLTAKEGEAGIARTSVALPHSEFLAQSHIKTICTRVQFAADQCPKGSIYGKVTATTPLLDQPLAGPVYLRSSTNPLPDLVAALHGQIDVDLVGRIDSSNGGIRTTFASVPDAPVSRFVLQMQGGKKGLLENSRNLCKSVNKATVQMDGQNGKAADFSPVLTNSCGKKHKAAKKKGKPKKNHGRARSTKH